MNKRQPYTIRSSSMLKLSLMLQNCFSVSVMEAFWFGNPFMMTSFKPWYTWSSSACLRSSWRCKFSWSGGCEVNARTCESDGAGLSIDWPPFMSTSCSARLSSFCGVRLGVPGKRICCFVFGAFEPLSSEIVCHYASPQAL